MIQITLVGVAWLAWGATLVADKLPSGGPPASGPSEAAVEPLPEVQMVVDRVARSRSDAEFFRHVSVLMEVRDRNALDAEALYAQVVHYMSRDRRDDPQAQGIAVYGWRLLGVLDATPGEALAAVTPYLESDDERLRGIAHSVLRVHVASVQVGRSGRPHFPELVGFFKWHGDESNPPERTTLYAFRLNPRAALHTLLAAYYDADGPAFEQGKALRAADYKISLADSRRAFPEPEKVLQAAVGELDTLTRDERWWVRLYAVEMMIHNYELARQDLVGRLAEDKHSGVRQRTISALRRSEKVGAQKP